MLGRVLAPILSSALVPATVPSTGGAGDARAPIVFATFVEDPPSIANFAHLAASVREFAGACRRARICLYLPEELARSGAASREPLTSLGVEVRVSEAPPAATWLPYARKVFAAAQAEAEAEGCAEVLAWLDDDTIVLQEPGEFLLPAGKSLGYRPVMHKNIGLLWDDPLDDFWRRAYERMAVSESALFPVVTPADGDTLRAYVNAGCLALRPERGILRKWAQCFASLYQDSVLVETCRRDGARRVFLHQVALVGAIVNGLGGDERSELSERYNYPIFFQQMFGARREFNDLTAVVTFRHESYFRNPAPDWEQRLRGPADRIAWIKGRLSAAKAD